MLPYFLLCAYFSLSFAQFIQLEAYSHPILDEVDYLTKYNEFKRYLEDEFEMPDKLIALLVRFLEQNNGKLSQRAKEKEFVNLTENEIQTIEIQYYNIFFKS